MRWFFGRLSVLPVCMCVLSHSVVSDSVTYSYGPPGSSAHGILQARILKWIAVPSSRRPSGPRDRTQVSSALAGRFFTTSATWKAPALQPACWIRSSERRNICIVNKTPRWFWGSPESQNHCTCLSVNSGYYWHMGQLVIFIFFSLYFPQLTCLEIKERYDLNV